jgi:hypothetical protein
MADTDYPTDPASSPDDKFPLPFDGMPLLTMDDEGKVPQARLTKASRLRSVYVRFRDDDQVNAANRSQMQLLLDGEPPYEQSEMNESGQPDMTNLNFNGAQQRLERAMAPYYSTIQSPELLVQVETNYGPDDEKQYINAILSEELTQTIRDYPQFTYQLSRLAHKHVWEGISFLHWTDEIDWRFRCSGLGQFYIPRQTQACEDDLEIAIVVEEYTVTRLYRAIQNEEVAIANGWNPQEVKKAIRTATAITPIYLDWERLTDELKNNDISVSHNTPVIRVINGYIKEFDGTVSHYITTERPGDGEAFLYCSRQKYQNMSQAFVMFPYGIGTNTKTHSIRGLGYKVFPFEQQRNRSICRFIDQSLLASSLMLQATDEESLASVGLQYFGNTAIVDPNCKVVSYTPPDLSRTVEPALNLMDRLVDARTENYTGEGPVMDGASRKTKYQVSAEMQQGAQLSESSLDFWYGPWNRGLRETVRRIARRNYLSVEPGGREVNDLILRLTKRGVPAEALYQINISKVKAVRSIGGGSAAARTVALDKLSMLRPRMDDVGQQFLDRALAVDAVGTSWADTFFPRQQVKRTTPETGIAILQNTVLLGGQDVPVLPSDPHLTHAREHIKPLIDGFQAVEQGQLPMDQMAKQMQLLYEHCAKHVEAVSGDDSAEAEAASLRQALQQIGEVIANGIKKANAEAEKQQQEAAQQQQQQPQGQPGQPQGQPGAPDQAQPGPTPGEAPFSPDQIAAFEHERQKMQFAEEAHQLKLQHMEQEAATKRAIMDADGAAAIARRQRASSLDQPTV